MKITWDVALVNKGKHAKASKHPVAKDEIDEAVNSIWKRKNYERITRIDVMNNLFESK